jgi:hypothetical protein
LTQIGKKFRDKKMHRTIDRKKNYHSKLRLKISFTKALIWISVKKDLIKQWQISSGHHTLILLAKGTKISMLQAT